MSVSEALQAHSHTEFVCTLHSQKGGLCNNQ